LKKKGEKSKKAIVVGQHRIFNFFLKIEEIKKLNVNKERRIL